MRRHIGSGWERHAERSQRETVHRDRLAYVLGNVLSSTPGHHWLNLAGVES